MYIPFVKLSTSFILLTLNVWIALLFHISLYRNQKQKTFFNTSKLNIMKALNNTKKLFTTGQLIGLVLLASVVVTLVVAITTGDISGFNSVGLGK